jgi:hypothetical protein
VHELLLDFLLVQQQQSAPHHSQHFSNKFKIAHHSRVFACFEIFALKSSLYLTTYVNDCLHGAGIINNKHIANDGILEEAKYKFLVNYVLKQV